MGVDDRVVADFRILSHVGKGQYGHILAHPGRRMDEGVLADAALHFFRGPEQGQQPGKAGPGILHGDNGLRTFKLGSCGDHNGPCMGFACYFQIRRNSERNLVGLGFFQPIDSLNHQLRVSLQNFPLQCVSQFL